jgi:hypothetical protein
VESPHCPSAWQTPGIHAGFKSAFFMTGLHEVSAPPEIEHMRPPQRPMYVELEN